jgi:hypothetical protein
MDRKFNGFSLTESRMRMRIEQSCKDKEKLSEEEELEEERAKNKDGKIKGSHGKACWKGYRRGKGDSCHKVEEEIDLEETDEMLESRFKPGKRMSWDDLKAKGESEIDASGTDIEPKKNVLNRAISHGKTVRKDPNIIQRGDGTVRPAIIKSRYVKGKDGKLRRD